ncbi:small membrane protein YdgU [Buttiauxella massiliensis]
MKSLITRNTRLAGCFFIKPEQLLKRFRFEIILMMVILYGVVAAGFFL